MSTHPKIWPWPRFGPGRKKGGDLRLILFKKISKSYNDLPVLDDFSYTINSGEFICICGPSGVGKTTILNLIAGLLRPDTGILEISSSRIGYVFQEPRLLPWCNVIENIEIGLFAAGFMRREERLGLVRTLLHKVALNNFSDYYPSQLSGGMKQRVALARAFAVEPEILLMDEPFSALDYDLKKSMRNCLLELLAWKPCISILVSHDLDEAVRLADKIVVVRASPCQIVQEFSIIRPRDQRNEKYVFNQVNKIRSLIQGTKWEKEFYEENN